MFYHLDGFSWKLKFETFDFISWYSAYSKLIPKQNRIPIKLHGNIKYIIYVISEVRKLYVFSDFLRLRLSIIMCFRRLYRVMNI
jgi:hypothetical protein